MNIRSINHLAGSKAPAKSAAIVKKEDNKSSVIPQDKVIKSSNDTDSKMAQMDKLGKGKKSWHGSPMGSLIADLAKIGVGTLVGIAGGATAGAYACAAGGPVAAALGGVLGGIVGGAAGTFAAYKIVT